MKTAVCIASGPSLTESDCQLVQNSGLFTIVTNNTFELCPWADVLYAMDGKWWGQNIDNVREQFTGRKVCPIQQRWKDVDCIKFKHGTNSGHGAIELARYFGAQRIILLGYDCQHTWGKRHWHADHPAGFGNAEKVDQWHTQFGHLARSIRTPVINASRETSLTCFPRIPLEQALCEQ